ncbi:TrkA family potassium uptake protein [Streptomyces sp. N35]|uniref:potassium channel family protein n=1 Tax=Streptomyces sp. N35 TaxID=2795730 RepID=UPI0018F7B337|nr:TrkA family potassium uptake protein [Streptomyces sp. N35]
MNRLLSRRTPRARHGIAPTDQRVAVIGLGRFGSSLATELVRHGWDVLGIDTDVLRVQRMSEELTHAVVADCSEPEAVEQLALHEYTRVVVAIGNSIEASVLVTSNLADLGCRTIWAKGTSRRHGQILERVGAHHVVLPEHEMGERVAHLVTGRMLDFFRLDQDFALVKTSAPAITRGVPLGESKLRTLLGVTVVAVKKSGGEFAHASADTVVDPGDILIVTGRTDAVDSFSNLP